MRFADIPGHDEIKAKLIRSVREDRLAHALLFAGEEGSWNLPMALALISYINCENPDENDSCGTCPSCSQNEKFVHPDVNFVFPLTTQAGKKPPEIVSVNFLKEFREFLTQNAFGNITDWSPYIKADNKPFNISKEESRQIIQGLSLKSFLGKYKITIIWLPEYMHPSAANGILKILEEPADKTVFMLVSNQSAKLLGTVISRTRQIVMKKPTIADISVWLQKNADCDSEKADKISRLSDGNLSNALSLLEDENDKLIAFFRDWLLACYSYKYHELVVKTEEFSKMSKVGQAGFLQYGQNVLRESLLIISGIDRKEHITNEFYQFVSKFSSLLNEDKIERFSKLMANTAFLFERNANPKVTFMNFSLNTCTIIGK